MSMFENEQQYLTKIRKLALDEPTRLLSELHEAHYLFESGVISEECYERVKEIVNMTKKKLR